MALLQGEASRGAGPRGRGRHRARGCPHRAQPSLLAGDTGAGRQAQRGVRGHSGPREYAQLGCRGLPAGVRPCPAPPPPFQVAVWAGLGLLRPGGRGPWVSGIRVAGAPHALHPGPHRMPRLVGPGVCVCWAGTLAGSLGWGLCSFPGGGAGGEGEATVDRGGFVRESDGGAGLGPDKEPSVSGGRAPSAPEQAPSIAGASACRHPSPSRRRRPHPASHQAPLGPGQLNPSLLLPAGSGPGTLPEPESPAEHPRLFLLLMLGALGWASLVPTPILGDTPGLPLCCHARQTGQKHGPDQAVAGRFPLQESLWACAPASWPGVPPSSHRPPRSSSGLQL